MASEKGSPGILTSGSFVIGVTTGFVLAIGMLLGTASLIGQRFIEEIGAKSESPSASSLEVPNFPDTTGSTYGTVPEDWRLRSVAGGDTTTFAAFQEGPVVLNVWATWCQPCRAELPTLQALHDSTGTVLLVSTESRSTARTFLDQSGYSMPAYVTDEFPSVLEGRAVPRTYVLGREGRIVYSYVGAANWNRPSTYAFLQQMRRGSVGAQPNR